MDGSGFHRTRQSTVLDGRSWSSQSSSTSPKTESFPLGRGRSSVARKGRPRLILSLISFVSCSCLAGSARRGPYQFPLLSKITTFFISPSISCRTGVGWPQSGAGTVGIQKAWKNKTDTAIELVQKVPGKMTRCLGTARGCTCTWQS